MDPSFKHILYRRREKGWKKLKRENHAEYFDKRTIRI
jgi:hypothetical protein